MGAHYSHIILSERRQISEMLEAKVPVAAIARALGRHKATIHREISRNFYHTAFRDRWGHDHRGYYSLAAHRMAVQRR